jgi:hypothetical protein
MAVTLVKPFLWPRVPSDLAPWDKALFDCRDKDLAAARAEMEAKTVRGIIPELNRRRLDRNDEAVGKKAEALMKGERWGADVELDEKWRTEEEVEEEGNEAAEQHLEATEGSRAAREYAGNHGDGEEAKKLKWKPWLRRYA